MISPQAGYTARPATQDDIDRMARLVQAVDQHDEGIVEPVRPHSRMSGRIRCSILPRTRSSRSRTMGTSRRSRSAGASNPPRRRHGSTCIRSTAGRVWGPGPCAGRSSARVDISPPARGRCSVRASPRTRAVPRGYGVSLRPHVLAHVAATRWGGALRLDADGCGDQAVPRRRRPDDPSRARGRVRGAFRLRADGLRRVGGRQPPAPSTELDLIFLAEREGEAAGAIMPASPKTSPGWSSWVCARSTRG